SGYKVWPSEVESLMYRHPGIHECCVISTPDPKRGESVKACIVPTEEAWSTVTADEIRNWCREMMAAYKVPQEIEFVDELPKSQTGKVMWRSLQEEEWKESS
ncbi:MAG: long-chain fatty acid--CoA ligase, partial [Anaerolineae bacterium]|nr:long-chain fatty acid--CoA ligase [Anaerolineae bacterium]